MNTVAAVRCTYIICSALSSILLLAVAIITPVFFTPGNYWWSGLAIFMIVGNSCALTKRMNQWGGMGQI